MKVLFVENHAVFAATVSAQFLGDHSVTIVPSVQAGRDAIARETWDAALVDFDLDDAKGDELVRELRERIPQLRIIAMSAHEAGNAALVAAGADAVCPKLKASSLPALLTPPRAP